MKKSEKNVSKHFQVPHWELIDYECNNKKRNTLKNEYKKICSIKMVINVSFSAE